MTPEHDCVIQFEALDAVLPIAAEGVGSNVPKLTPNTVTSFVGEVAELRGVAPDRSSAS